jgi:hypothetical protein
METSREDLELQLEAQLHSSLLGRPYGAPTPLEACLCSVRGTTSYCLNIDCVILCLGSLGTAQDALAIAVRQSLQALDVDQLNAAVAGASDANASEVGIQAGEFKAQVASLPAMVSTCQVLHPLACQSTVAVQALQEHAPLTECMTHANVKHTTGASTLRARFHRPVGVEMYRSQGALLSGARHWRSGWHRAGHTFHWMQTSACTDCYFQEGI